MSTGLECEIVQWAEAEWYYILQDYDCPVGAWDWMEYATAYGPFKSEDAAHTHLRDYHANPGGYSTLLLDPAHDHRKDEALRKLVASARR